MITLGIILLIIGLIFGFGVLVAIGGILIIVGLAIAVLGFTGRTLLWGRRHIC